MEILNWHHKNNAKPFKVGDYVRVKEDLSISEAYDKAFTKDMLYFRGLVTQISWVFGNGIYALRGDDDYTWHPWSRDMLEPASKEDVAGNTKFVRCDKVRIVPDISYRDPDIVPNMPTYAGYTAFVTDINFVNGGIELNIDGGQHWWNPKYLRRITEEEWWKENKSFPSTIPGRFVRIKDDPGSCRRVPAPVAYEMSKYGGKVACIDTVDSFAGTFSLVGVKSSEDCNLWWAIDMVDFID